jgi:tRNA (guanine-N7-)-methyltransferase
MRRGDDATRPDSGFFGRRKGKALRPGQQQALDTVLPRLKLDLSAPPPQPLTALFPVPVDAVRLEIGFGGGEHLLHAARAHPATGFIGVEPFESGLAKAVTRIAQEGIQNIRIHDDDALPLLDWLPAGALKQIDLLYPDPWPKKRHWKRRFVNGANLARFARLLAADGRFRFATDIADYAEWTREKVAESGLLLIAGDSAEPWPGWPGTRYEAKAVRAGRAPRYLTFKKAEGANFP